MSPSSASCSWGAHRRKLHRSLGPAPGPNYPTRSSSSHFDLNKHEYCIITVAMLSTCALAFRPFKPFENVTIVHQLASSRSLCHLPASKLSGPSQLFNVLSIQAVSRLLVCLWQTMRRTRGHWPLPAATLCNAPRKGPLLTGFHPAARLVVLPLSEFSPIRLLVDR